MTFNDGWCNVFSISGMNLITIKHYNLILFNDADIHLRFGKKHNSKYICITVIQHFKKIVFFFIMLLTQFFLFINAFYR